MLWKLCLDIEGLSNMIRTYSELIRIPSFEDRLNYLHLHGVVAHETFGSNRWLNQAFYSSREWLNFRAHIIERDFGCDLGCKNHPIQSYERIIIHHMNPIDLKDVQDRTDLLLDPEQTICTTLLTHNFIHYGTSNAPTVSFVERTPFDTCPWRK